MSEMLKEQTNTMNNPNSNQQMRGIMDNLEARLYLNYFFQM